jgi:hypothetical protein
LKRILRSPWRDLLIIQRTDLLEPNTAHITRILLLTHPFSIEQTITGGAGFIGSNLIQQLNQQGECNILVVDSLAPAPPPTAQATPFRRW